MTIFNFNKTSALWYSTYFAQQWEGGLTSNWRHRKQLRKAERGTASLPPCHARSVGSSHDQTQDSLAPTPALSPAPRWYKSYQCWRYLETTSARQWPTGVKLPSLCLLLCVAQEATCHRYLLANKSQVFNPYPRTLDSADSRDKIYTYGKLSSIFSLFPSGPF